MEIVVAVVALILPFLFDGDGNDQNNQSTDSQGGEATPVLVANGSPTAIPTPALLPGLIGLGLGALRKRKSEEVETEA